MVSGHKTLQRILCILLSCLWHTELGPKRLSSRQSGSTTQNSPQNLEFVALVSLNLVPATLNAPQNLVCFFSSVTLPRKTLHRIMCRLLFCLTLPHKPLHKILSSLRLSDYHIKLQTILFVASPRLTTTQNSPHSFVAISRLRLTLTHKTRSHQRLSLTQFNFSPPRFFFTAKERFSYTLFFFTIVRLVSLSTRPSLHCLTKIWFPPKQPSLALRETAEFLRHIHELNKLRFDLWHFN